ncbi:Predicted O-linked N-acetylglucosamine transferase, SPINDLY family [Singulisphaera sp. GP187]|uniref:tetratricopeptide repeat protein n=1 Tax=Singulisphaera sp. GP187 TaxID=1882752 RepID=UPI000928164F|nr:tetratricopeptide repeat protein [Singulisphaera sp. GP187]SIO13922.1 Predicted O-linked N-acetylglucosamine transferase, SPINDLY family [Singulisphaera sp. GP187]
MATIESLFERAKLAHQEGRVAQAELAYRQVLQAEPSHVPAWYLLGVACHGLGNLTEARGAFQQTLRLQPDHVDAQNQLGIVWAQAGSLEDAVRCFRLAVQLQPNSLDAYKNLAVTFERLGRLDEAIACDHRVVELKPDLADAHRHLGVLLRKQGRWDEAIRSLQRVLQIKPEIPETLNDLGLLLEMTGQFDEAVAQYQAAIRLRPEFPGAYSNMSVVLKQMGRLDEAVTSGREAVRLDPSFAGAHNNLGVILEKKGTWDEAITCFHAALRLDPRFVEAYYNLGSVLSRLGRFEESESQCRQAITLAPDSPEAHHNLAFALSERGRLTEAEANYRRAIELKPEFVDPYVNLTSVLGKFGKLDEAEACSREAVRLDPNRTEALVNLGFVLIEKGHIAEALAAYREAERVDPNSRPVQSSYLYGLNYDPEADPETLLAEHRRWGLRQQEDAPTIELSSAHDRARDRPLRVGYVSADFRVHPVAYFLRHVLRHHDRRQVEPIGYSEVTAPDAMTAELESLSDAWRPIYGMNDEQVAELIQRDRLDILVDLSGHTARHRMGLFAHKPAPIQVTYLGYPNTTGLATIDYLLTDAIADPPDDPTWSSEIPYHLPDVFCCYSPPEEAPEVNPLPALQAQGVTFGSLHKLPKLNSRVLELWAELLRSIPTARLLLYRNNLRGQRKEEIEAFFRAQGITADRLELRNIVEGGGNHYQIYQDIDISLDVFPWSGHTTACESVWMGVPIVTLRGNRHAGRMTASVLTCLGLNDWIAETPQQYLDIAQRFASDRTHLAELRRTMRTRMNCSPMGDGQTWTKNLENAYRTMWHQWIDKNK